MENLPLLIALGCLFVLTVYVAGYKKGVSVGKNSGREMRDLLERKLDQYIGLDRDDENDYWRQDYGK